MQNFGVTNKEYYGMLWYFLEWSIISRKKKWRGDLTETVGAHERLGLLELQARAVYIN